MCFEDRQGNLTRRQSCRLEPFSHPMLPLYIFFLVSLSISEFRSRCHGLPISPDIQGDAVSVASQAIVAVRGSWPGLGTDTTTTLRDWLVTPVSFRFLLNFDITSFQYAETGTATKLQISSPQSWCITLSFDCCVPRERRCGPAGEATRECHATCL